MRNLYTRAAPALGACVAASLLLLLSTASRAADAPATADTWRLVSEKNGISIFRQEDEDRPIKRFRATKRMAVANPAAFEALLNDYDFAPRWAHFVSAVREISRRDYGDRRLYFTTALPWPLADRDVVTLVTYRNEADRFVSVFNDDDTAPPEPGYVRMPDLYGRLDVRFLPVNHEAIVTYEASVDPGGYIPTWAVNLALKDVPYFTLLKLERLVNEPRFRDFRSEHFTYPW